MLKVLRCLLKTLSLKNNTSVCRNGEEALDFLYKRNEFANAVTPDLVLMDLNMPKISGFEVLEQMKNDPKLSMIPVIILSTSSAEKDIVKSYQNHANSYIKKPIDFVEFIEVIKEVENYWFSTVQIPSSHDLE